VRAELPPRGRGRGLPASPGSRHSGLEIAARGKKADLDLPEAGQHVLPAPHRRGPFPRWSEQGLDLVQSPGGQAGLGQVDRAHIYRVEQAVGLRDLVGLGQGRPGLLVLTVSEADLPQQPQDDGLDVGFAR